MLKLKMVDIHFHLSYFQDKEKIIKESKEKLKALISCALNLKEAKDFLVLKEKNPQFFFFTLGFHPFDEDKFSEKILKDYDDFLKENSKEILALGEIGLDYFYPEKNRKRMKEIFLTFLDLAKGYDLPVLIHCRDAFEDLLEILKEKNISRVILHCFSGSEGVLKESLKRGYFISFATNLCYTKKHPRLAKMTPLENLLLETDAPWLDPFSQGKKFENKPWNILESAKVISQIKKKSEKEILEIVFENAKKILNF